MNVKYHCLRIIRPGPTTVSSPCQTFPGAERGINRLRRSPGLRNDELLEIPDYVVWGADFFVGWAVTYWLLESYLYTKPELGAY